MIKILPSTLLIEISLHKRVQIISAQLGCYLTVKMDNVSGAAFGSVAKLFGIGIPRDDDFIDRLNHRVTVAIFGVFIVFVTTKEFVGEPIHCWFTQDDKEFHADYVNNFCWIRNTYYVSFDESIPRYMREKEMNSIKYYQWIPVILLLQILLFKLPNIIWTSFKSANGININKICSLSESTQMGDSKTRTDDIKNIAVCIYRWRIFCLKRLHFRKRIPNPLIFTIGSRILYLYIFVKILYISNIFIQFYALSSLLGKDFVTFGQDIFSDKDEIKESKLFPRITFCDFEIRQMNNILPHTTQCVLSINLFIEKIYAFVWFWLFLLGIVNCISLVKCFHKLCFRTKQGEFIEPFLPKQAYRPSVQKREVRRFINVCLGSDGIFLLRTVSANSSPLVMMDLVEELWNLHQK